MFVFLPRADRTDAGIVRVHQSAPDQQALLYVAYRCGIFVITGGQPSVSHLLVFRVNSGDARTLFRCVVAFSGGYLALWHYDIIVFTAPSLHTSDVKFPSPRPKVSN